MKIIFSPSKSKKLEMGFVPSLKSKTLYKEETDVLVEKFCGFTLRDAVCNFKVTEKKAHSILELYKKFTKLEKIPALHLFSGTSFLELGYKNYGESEQKYAQNNLVILSALHGIIRPYDLISDYRLDMNDIKLSDGKNLYGYWQKYIDDYFRDETLVINLASSEYSKLLKNFTGRIINVSFKIMKNGKLKSVSVISKQQRGKLLNFIIINKPLNEKFLSTYRSMDFQYCKKLSDDDNYVFIKNE